jgi:hypothetical protein
MSQRNAWKDLSPLARGRVMIMGVLQVALLIAALRDLRRRPAEAINGNKRLWTALVFINFIGPIAYFVFGRKRSTEQPQNLVSG